MDEKLQVLAGRGYELVRALGRGSQGEVFLVKQIQKGCFYACKIGYGKQLLREGEVLRQLAHPGFPRFIESWKRGEACYIVMEYIEGGTLEKRLQCGAVSLKEAVRWGRELGEAICHLHDMAGAWVVRDIKPANIMVGRKGHLKLIDLGCACQREEIGMAKAGSWGYSAPEQFEMPGQVSEASDIYAWGKVMKEILSHCRIRGMRQWFLRRKLKGLISQCTVLYENRRIESIRAILVLLDKH